ncbi:MAG TPA: LLM class F420-dependent oxidoreductase [Anaerolineaceae bacterium]
MSALRVGVLVQPQHTTYSSFAGAVRQVESLGVDTIWDWDHFFPCWGDAHGSAFEGWTLLTAMATLTARAEIGCLVTCNSYRSPDLLADMARTIDHISAGRLILGIGAGWFERDYLAYGYPFGTPRSRLEHLEKNLPLILERWLQLTPRPTRQIPILIGGGGEKVTLRLAARYADIWNGFGPAAEYAHKNQVLDDWCAQVGRDPREIERSVTLDTDDIPGCLEPFVEAGASHVIVHLSEPWNFAKIEKLVRWKESLV